MANASDVGLLIGSILSDKNQMKQELVFQGGTSAFGYQFGGNIYPEHRSSIVSSNVISSDTFVIGHPVQGVMDEGYKWVSSTGGYDSQTWVRVVNQNNTFEDYFETNRFIDTVNSTGLWSSTLFEYQLDSSDILQSKSVAINNQIYTRATLTVSASDTTYLTSQLSFNGGTSWQTVTLGTESIGSSTTISGLKYKLTCTSSSTAIYDVKLSYS